MDPRGEGSDEVAERVWSCLESGDVEGATRTFTPQLRSALPPERLEGVWFRLTAQLGRLREWAPLDGGSATPRRFRLRFERGALLGLLAVDPASGQVSGLHFRPDPDNPG